MLDSVKMGKFIMNRRKACGMTQQQLAEKLDISFQAVSKWENGTAYPGIEILPELAAILKTTVDEILAGREQLPERLSYSKAGVDIAFMDSVKKEMAEFMFSKDKRVLGGIGPFAALYDIRFPDVARPVLILKSEEPGSKQKLAMEYGYTESICHDMINHLVNDIVVMGAKPLAVLDTIVCGNAEKDTIKTLIKGISEACRENECSLVGGETSIQPGVVENGLYVLTASIAGIADRDSIVDGSRIREGDSVLAVASNGLHTNGYSLVRLLMEKRPEIKLDHIKGMTFTEQIMKPHTPYYQAVREHLGKDYLHGMAHITGGGIEGNLRRVIPDGFCARIDLNQIRILPIFHYVKQQGQIQDSEMLHTFNIGVGFVLIVSPEQKEQVIRQVSRHFPCYEIGKIGTGKDKVAFTGKLNWKHEKLFS